MRSIIVFLIVVLALGIFATSWYRAGRASEEKPMLSIVFLLESPRILTEDDLRERVNQAFGADLQSGSEEEGFVAGEGHMNMVILKKQEMVINVLNLPAPYMPVTDKFLDGIPELRLRSALSKHQAWMSVDWIDGAAAEDSTTVYRALGKLAASLLEDDVLAVCLPAFDICKPMQETIRENLLSDDPVAALSSMDQVPVRSISGTDPRIIKAVAEARRRWPEFTAAFRAATKREDFSVKAPISDQDSTEFIWISVTRITDSAVYGTLGNDPIGLDGLKFGDPVEISVKDVNDWMYIKDDEAVGGFTVKVLTEK